MLLWRGWRRWKKWNRSRSGAATAMDAQQQLDLVMRHQSMATVCESEVAWLSPRPCLRVVPRFHLFASCSDRCVGRCPGFARLWWLQDALGSSESDPARPARPRGKRSRAAEVHNLSEKVGA